ncbi:hypothetical protein [Alicyclobacillus sp.]|uniref:hypothetical protein n=1 Tax=Alicyclobacillus sp. TaxID=61169 RepID=UPI0025C11ED8|nr:hypothetical protein [Alicyclobacillus sp.]MCL6515334.1 hypothetical protein [Alicyclobacillus sp.]
MFRRIGKLWRLWELYTFWKSFTPAGYAMDRAFTYVLDRLRALDWVYLVLAVLLAILWALEGLNWVLQAVLAISRSLGLTTAVWPRGPVLGALGGITLGQVVWWLLAGLLWAISVLRWLAALLRRLWPAQAGQAFVWVSGTIHGRNFVHRTGGPQAPRTTPIPSGALILCLAWLADALILAG